MQFFIPHAESIEQQESVYADIKAHLAQGRTDVFSPRRIRRLSWSHNGRKHDAVVGQATTFNGEEVIAILYDAGSRLYHVCTPNRGVLTGGSIFAGEHAVTWHEDFDAAVA